MEQWCHPVDLLLKTVETGLPEDDAQRTIIGAADRGNIIGTGFGRTSSFSNDRAVGPVHEDIEGGMRTTVHDRLWKVLLRADRSEDVNTFADWYGARFSYEVRVAGGTLQHAWNGVLFEPELARNFIARLPRVQRKRGRQPWPHYANLIAGIVSEIEAAPHLFTGADGRIRKMSEQPHERTALQAAIDWRDRHHASGGPADETLKRKLNEMLAPRLKALGFETWRDDGRNSQD